MLFQALACFFIGVLAKISILKLRVSNMEQDYLSLAIQQILWEFKLNPDLDLENKLQQAFEFYDNENRKMVVKHFMQQLDYQDFEWQYFNECVKFCRDHNIIPYDFHFLFEYPKAPKNVVEFLEQLTVSEMKQIAKNKGVKGLPTRKAEMISAISQQLKAIDLQDDAKKFMRNKMIDYNKKLFQEKCNLLVFGIFQRYTALQKNEKKIDLRIFEAQLGCIAHDRQDDTAIFMKHCIVKYPQPDPQTGRFLQLPPYFLGDPTFLYYKYKRREK